MGISASNSSNIQYAGTAEEWAQLKEDTIEARQGMPATRVGAYPTTKGYILVTDVLWGWQDPQKSWTGHAGIVHRYDQTVEAFPKDGVRFRENNWNYKYSSRNIYGLVVNASDYASRAAAANWAVNRIGVSSYNLMANHLNNANVNCASLVYHAYKQQQLPLIGVNGVVTPMALVNSSSTQTVYTNF